MTLHSLSYWNQVNTRPVVSIICITFNHEQYIEDALCGFLLQQTDFPFEIIIHDDASTDSTVKIVEKYRKRFPNSIKLVTQSTNQYSQGVHIISKYLFPLSKGDYIAFCEGDDYWIDVLKLQRQYDVLNADASIGFCGHSSITVSASGGRILTVSQMYRNSCVVRFSDMLERIQSFATASFFVRREVYQSYMDSGIEALDAHGDYKMSLYFGSVTKVYYFADFMSVYRSMTTSSINRSIALSPDTTTIQRKLMDGRIEVLETIDLLTDHVYSAYVEAGKRSVVYAYLLSTRNGREILRQYRDLLRSEPLKRKLTIYAEAISPRLLGKLFDTHSRLRTKRLA